MTFLELCQAVVDEAGLSGSISTVTNQKGDFARVVRNVRTACQQIEGRYLNWRFLHGTYKFSTLEDTTTYSAPENLNIRQWELKTAFLDDLSINATYADDRINYEKDLNAESYKSRPIRIIVERNNDLRFIGIPDDVYQVQIEYYKMPIVLTENTDEPNIPSQFQDIIVYDALRRYANYDEAAELKAQAIEQIYGVNGSWVRPEPGSLLHMLMADQLPYTYLHGATQDGEFVVVAQ